MKTKERLQSLVLAALLALGFAAVWGVVGLWGLEVAAYVVLVREGETVTGPLRFQTDGTPVVTYHAGRHGGEQYRDLQGNPVPAPDSEHAFLAPVSLPADRPGREPKAETSWDNRIRSFADGRVPPVWWYFLSDGRPDGGGYFVGYDSESRARVGYLGTAGFRDGPLPAEERIPFAGAVADRTNARLLSTQDDHHTTEHPRHRSAGRAPRGSVSTWDVYVLGRDGKLYHADLQNRTVQVAFDASPVRSAALAAGLADAVHGTPHQPAVRTDDAVLVLDERGQVRKRFPIPEVLNGRDFHFAETSTGEAVLYWRSPADLLAAEQVYRICWVDAAGQCRQAETALPTPSLERGLPWAGLVVPSPLPLAATVVCMRPPSLLQDGLATTYPEALARTLTEFRAALAVAQVVAVLLAVLCYRRQVRYGASRGERLMWSLFVLLLGLPGWIGYRFGRSWPVLERCPTCGVGVPRDRGCCTHCEVEFPEPALRGTEVFA